MHSWARGDAWAAVAAVALAGLVPTSGLAPASRHTRQTLLIGVQDDPVFVRLPSSYGGGGTRGVMPVRVGYERLTAFGANVLRIAVHWATVEPTRSPRAESWGYYDAAIARAREHGLLVQLALSGPAPAFAASDHRVGVERPSATAFARFARATATRYRGQVTAYSIWNEPNWWNLLKPAGSAPSVYRSLYRAGYTAIKRADPSAQVLIGELAPIGEPGSSTAPLRFLRELTCVSGRLRPAGRCGRLVADGFALHPYTLRWQPTFRGIGADDVTTGSLARLVRALAQLARLGALSTPGGVAPAVYLTEYGWHAHSTISESQRAAYAVAGYATAARVPQVKEIVWYQLAGPPPIRKGIWDTALLTQRGKPLPVFTSLRAWIATQTEP